MNKSIAQIGLLLLLVSGLIVACSATGGPSSSIAASTTEPPRAAQATITPLPAISADIVPTVVPLVVPNTSSPLTRQTETVTPTAAPTTPSPPTQQSKKVRLPFLIGQPYEEGVRELINAGIPNYLPEDGDNSDVPLGTFTTSIHQRRP